MPDRIALNPVVDEKASGTWFADASQLRTIMLTRSSLCAPIMLTLLRSGLVLLLAWTQLPLLSFAADSLPQAPAHDARAVKSQFGNVAMGGGGFVSGIITSKNRPDLLYARTDVGGAYRWNAKSQQWVPLLDWVSSAQLSYLGVESLALDPNDANKVYLLVGTSYFNGGASAVLRSKDQGQTFAITDVTSIFKVHGNGMGRQSGEKLVVDPNKGSVLFCGSRSNGLFKSSDSGASWSRVANLDVTTTANGNGISLVVFDPATGSPGAETQTLFVGVSRPGENLYRSNDGGVSFHPIKGAPATLMPQRAVLSSDRNLYVTYANGAGPHGSVSEAMNSGQIWKYHLPSGAWTDVTPVGFALPYSGISIDPHDPQRIIASSTNTYWKQGEAWGDQFLLSTNGGKSWTNLINRSYQMDGNGVTWMTNQQSIHWAGSIEFDPFNGKRVWVTSGNGIFKTDNIDAIPTIWKFTVKGLEETVPMDVASIPGGPLISVIADYDGFVNKDVSKYGPQHSPKMGTTRALAYAARKPNVLLRAGSSMYYSTDTGETWTRTTMNGSQGFVAISADAETWLHSPDETSTSYRSKDFGASWSVVEGLDFEQARVVADAVNPRKFYALRTPTGQLMVSENEGESFTAGARLPAGGSKNLRTVPGFEGHIWAALYGGGLMRSTDSGHSFTKLAHVTYCAAIGIGKAPAGSSYPSLYIWGTVNGIEGLHASTNLGASWIRINDDAHEWGGPGNAQFVIGDMNVFGRVYMSTAGRGLVYVQSDLGSCEKSEADEQ